MTPPIVELSSDTLARLRSIEDRDERLAELRCVLLARLSAPAHVSNESLDLLDAALVVGSAS